MAEDLELGPDLGGATPWTHLDVRDDPQRFHFAVLSDRTGGHRPGVFGDAVDKVNLLQPALVLRFEAMTEARLDAIRNEIETDLKKIIEETD